MQQINSSFNIADASQAVTGQVILSARAIVVQPDTGHPPSPRRWAWAVLKSARGQTISQSGLNHLTGGYAPKAGKAA